MIVADAGFKRWEYDQYELLSITPCENVLAVYAEEDTEEEGMFKLAAYPIRFLATAKRTTRFRQKPKNSPPGTVGMEYAEPDVENVVVGLELENGWFSVCNEMDNFAGYCFRGEDISNATGYLHCRKFPLSTDG